MKIIFRDKETGGDESPLIYRATGLEAYLIDPKEVQKLAPILKTSDIEVKLHYRENYCSVFDDKKEIVMVLLKINLPY
jgi:hypothetical protein